MFEFHGDPQKYFQINSDNTKKHILPFIRQKFTLSPGMRVLEIGCGEGGVLKPFLDEGLVAVGVELDEVRLVLARGFLSSEIGQGKLKFISKNIYDADLQSDLGGAFDIIVLKDVIEHIYGQEKLMSFMREMLTPKGVIFFGFPPWQMPWGGHQQILKNRFLSKIPYYHLLPMGIYKGILKRANENVQEMQEIKETGISIERFEKISKDAGFKILEKKHFLINPIYEYKFGWKPRKQNSLIQGIPWVRNFFTSCVYYLIEKKEI